MSSAPGDQGGQANVSENREPVVQQAQDAEALEESNSSDERPQEETPREPSLGDPHKCHSLDAAVLEQMDQILKLLESKFAPDKCIPQTARKLWNMPENAVDMPKDLFVGVKFLNSLLPGDDSLVKMSELESNSETFEKVSNIEIAYNTFKEWVTRSDPDLAPWNESYLVGSRDIIETASLWPTSSNFGRDEGVISGGSRSDSIFLAAFSEPSDFDEPLRFDFARFYYVPGWNHFNTTSACDRSTVNSTGVSALSGIVSHFTINRRHGIISFEEVAALLCLAPHQNDGWSGRDITPQILDGHISPWRRRFRPDDHWTDSTRRHFQVFTYMHYMRSFTIASHNVASGQVPTTGLRCQRESINVTGIYDAKPYKLTEKRYSIALSLLPLQSPSGHFGLVSITDTEKSGGWPASFSYKDSYSSGRQRKIWKMSGILPAGLYTGISLFQQQIHSTIDSWERDWISTIDFVDDLVSVKADVLNDNELLKTLVLKPKHDSSVEYFKVLQMVGFFSNAVRETETCLEALIPQVPESDYLDEDSHPRTADSIKILKFNWDIVMKHQREASARLLVRLERTKEEVNILRDGLFNVQSITEAQKSLALNQYLLVFAIVTIIYLPPTLVATVFGVDLFQSAATETFWKTVIGLSIGTYAFSAFGLFGFSLHQEEWSSGLERLFSWLKRQTFWLRTRFPWLEKLFWWLIIPLYLPVAVSVELLAYVRRKRWCSWSKIVSFLRATKSREKKGMAPEVGLHAETAAHDTV